MQRHAPEDEATAARRTAKQTLLHLKRSVVGPKVKKIRDRLDDNEVRKARRLVQAVRSGNPPDVVAFGDSNWVFRAGYDQDQRNLPAMIAAGLGPDVSFHVCASAGYYSTLIRALTRQISLNGGKPIVIVPLCARLVSVAWSIHPRYTYSAAIERIETFHAGTPLWRMRASFPPPSPDEYARYGSTEITTFAGTCTIDELRGPIIDPVGHGIDALERRRLLYAYHHGERVEEDAPTIVEVEALGRALRALDTEVVVFETTVPVDEGVALWGEQFRDNAAHSFQLMRSALRRGYGDPLDVLETGLAYERSQFIDPADGSEHLNEHGRRRMADALVEATKAAIAKRAD